MKKLFKTILPLLLCVSMLLPVFSAFAETSEKPDPTDLDKNGKSDYNIIRKQAQTDDINCRAESRNSKNSRTLFGAIIKRYKI